MSTSLRFLAAHDSELVAHKGKWIAWSGEVIDSAEADEVSIQAMLRRLGGRDYVLFRVR